MSTTRMIMMMTRIATMWANPRLRLLATWDTVAKGRARKVSRLARAMDARFRIPANAMASRRKEI